MDILRFLNMSRESLDEEIESTQSLIVALQIDDPNEDLPYVSRDLRIMERIKEMNPSDRARLFEAATNYKNATKKTEAALVEEDEAHTELITVADELGVTIGKQT